MRSELRGSQQKAALAGAAHWSVQNVSAHKISQVVDPRQELGLLIARGRSQRFYLDMLVTSEMAALMLEANTVNRPVRQVRVQTHIRRLEKGTFRLQPHGLAFASDGMLIDGQHRLMAISQSGIAGTMQAAFGCNRDEFSIIDGQAPRSAADMLHIDGQKNGAIKAAIAARLLAIQTGNDGPRRAPQEEVYDYVHELEADLLDASASVGQGYKKISNPTALGLAYYWIGSRTKHAASLPSYFSDLLEGGFAKGSPGVKLRDKLMQRRSFNPNAQLDPGGSAYNVSAAGVITLVWNYYVGKSRRQPVMVWAHIIKMPVVE